MSSQHKKTPPAPQSMSIAKAFSMSANKRKRKAVESEAEQSGASAPKRITEDISGIFVNQCSPPKKELDFETSAMLKDEEHLNQIPTPIEAMPELMTSEDIATNNLKNEKSDQFLVPVIVVSSDEGDQLSSSALSSSYLNTTNVSISSENKEFDDASASSMQTSNADSTKKSKRNRISGNEANPKDGNYLAVQSSVPRKKKKMSSEEAQNRTELRLQKEKEKRERMAQLSAKKEEQRQLKLFKELEKEERERLRKEKKEQEEKEKQQRLEERERRIRLKQCLVEAKEEQKKLKEQQKLKLQEERKKMEEEKKKLDIEKEMKKSKTKAAFESFFVKSGFIISPPQAIKKEIAFKPFQIADDMLLAPITPPVAAKRFDKEKLDHLLQEQNSSPSYLQLLKSGDYGSLKHLPIKKPALCGDDDDDVIIVTGEENTNCKLQAKLLQFCDNIRPAYWGTWQKESKNIRPRNPFGKVDYFDYDVDSDEEWDEGGPGESLTGTEDEESEDDYEVDNQFFVPHGYLSAEEEGDDESDDRTDPEELRQRLKQKEVEFLSKRNKKTIALKPEILGCFFQADNSDNLLLKNKLIQYSVETFSTVITFINIKNHINKKKTNFSDDHQNALIPNEAMAHLIKLLHANTNSRSTVANEFQEFWMLRNHTSSNELDQDLAISTMTENSDNEHRTVKEAFDKNIISKIRLKRTIRNIATWGRSPDPKFNKFCWWVKEDVLKKYGVVEPPVPNQWKYVTTLQNKDNQPVKPASSTRKTLFVDK